MKNISKETKELIDSIPRTKEQLNIGYLAMFQLADTFYSVLDRIYKNDDIYVGKIKNGLNRVKEGLEKANERTWRAILHAHENVANAKELADNLLVYSMKCYEAIAVFLVTAPTEKIEALANISKFMQSESVESIANRLGYPIINAMDEDDNKSFAIKTEIFDYIRNANESELTNMLVYVRKFKQLKKNYERTK